MSDRNRQASQKKVCTPNVRNTIPDKSQQLPELGQDHQF